MPLPNIFTKEVSDEMIRRINELNPDIHPKWGKMNATQMLAHCNVAYEHAYENIHPKPNFIIGFILKTFIKNKVVGDQPFSHNSKTGPEFIIKDSRNFEKEKKRLIDYIIRTQEFGESHFKNKESDSFGVLTSQEWNNMFYKHLDHHLSQFGV